MVGEDISAGLYKVERLPGSNGTNVFRFNDLSMKNSSLIKWHTFLNSGYVEILDTDKAVKIIGAQLTQIDLKTLTPNLQTELTTGIYLVGYDVAPGVYSIELLEGAQEGYIERSKSVNIELDTLIATYYIPGTSYLEIADTDFAIKLLNVRIKAK